MDYFASKASPTDMLLLYFEAISDLKANELNESNNSSGLSLHCLRPQQQPNSIFHNTHFFLDNVKANDINNKSNLNS